MGLSSARGLIPCTYQDYCCDYGWCMNELGEVTVGPGHGLKSPTMLVLGRWIVLSPGRAISDISVC